MEPFISDGEWVAVRATKEPVVGKITIAVIDGDSVCRRLKSISDVDGETFYTMDSANEKYESIRAREVRIQGIVIKRVTDV
jgi:SOS-response transcriptional repressor LexA